MWPLKTATASLVKAGETIYYYVGNILQNGVDGLREAVAGIIHPANQVADGQISFTATDFAHTGKMGLVAANTYDFSDVTAGTTIYNSHLVEIMQVLTNDNNYETFAVCAAGTKDGLAYDYYVEVFDPKGKLTVGTTYNGRIMRSIHAAQKYGHNHDGINSRIIGYWRKPFEGTALNVLTETDDLVEVCDSILGADCYVKNSTTVSFHNTNPDSIEDTAGKLGNFKKDDIVKITGSAGGLNDKNVVVSTVTDNTIVLIAGDSLVDQAVGPAVTLERQSQCIPDWADGKADDYCIDLRRVTNNYSGVFEVAFRLAAVPIMKTDDFTPTGYFIGIKNKKKSTTAGQDVVSTFMVPCGGTKAIFPWTSNPQSNSFWANVVYCFWPNDSGYQIGSSYWTGAPAIAAFTQYYNGALQSNIQASNIAGYPVICHDFSIKIDETTEPKIYLDCRAAQVDGSVFLHKAVFKLFVVAWRPV